LATTRIGLLEPVKVGEIVEGAGTTVDNAPLVAAGVPGGALLDSKGSSHYFNYHHSSAVHHLFVLSFVFRSSFHRRHCA
jgi:hypothetical protein